MSDAPLDPSLGATELGVLFSTALGGVMMVQCYTYYQNGFQDGRALKIFVLCVLFVELLHTGLLWGYLYTLTVTYFGQRDMLVWEHWTLRLSNPVTSLITSAVQCFFALRVYRLSKKTWYTIIACSLSMVTLGAGIASLVLTGGHTIAEYSEKYLWLLITSWCITATVDISNTVALCYYLYKAKAGSKVKRSQTVIDKLVLWAIETGLLTSVVVIIMIVLLLTMPSTNLVFMGIFCVKAKLYSNSLLASLNNRKRLRAKDEGSTDLHVQLSNIGHTLEFRRPVDVRVDVEESRIVDGTPSVSDTKLDFGVGMPSRTFDDRKRSASDAV